MSDTSNISAFKYFNLQYNRIVPPTVFIFGVVGNLLNLIILNRRALHNNPCTTFLLLLSITHLNNLILGLLPNYLADAYGIDILTATIVFCRCRFMILHCSLALSSWLIVLAGIDRFCISSRHVNRRNLSTLKNARLSVLVATVICCIVYSHVLVLFTIEKTPLGLVCYAQSGTYRVFYDFQFFATFSFTPPILMIIVGVGTFHNILRARGIVTPHTTINTGASTNNILHIHKKDRQFLKMLLLQLAFTVTLTVPIAVQKLYATFTQDVVKSASRLEIENFMAQAVRTLTQINSGLSFYLYTLSGTVFRLELVSLIRNIIKLIFGVNSPIYQRCRRMLGPIPTDHSRTIERMVITNRHVPTEQ